VINILISISYSTLTMLEAFLYSYTVNYFCNDKKVNKKIVFITFTTITFLTSYPILELLKPQWLIIIIANSSFFLANIIFYRKQLKKSLTCTCIIELIITTTTAIIQNNFYNIFANRNMSDSDYFLLCYILIVARFIISILQLKYIDKMCLLYQCIFDEGNSLLALIIILTILNHIFIISDNSMISGTHNKILRNISNGCFGLFLVLSFIYITRISSKKHEISKLNDDLKDNNNQLRKIKHDYGAQISYFYGLCLMDRYNDLEIALKDVIDRTKYSNKIKKSDSILQLAVETAIKSNDIKVTIEEKADLSKLIIPELELFRVLSNIISNAVEAMEGQGNIFAKAYQLEEKVIILIQNDGPEIPKDVLLDIFKTGFTTKDNTEKGHGFGLSIVKELVERYDGQINVASSEELTEFRIVFKCNK